MGYITRKEASDLINKYGFALFPTHGVVNGTCTCGQTCHSPGKHPLTSDGFYSATKDIDSLIKLIAGKRGVNLGIRTGDMSDIFVVDIDGPEGEKTWETFLNGRREPDTFKVKTGKGRHLYFRHVPGIQYAKNLGDKIDIKSDGGYVMAPGCNHINGSTYTITDDLPIATAEQWLIDGVKRKEVQKHVTASLNLIHDIKSSLQIGQKRSDSEIAEMLSKLEPDMPYNQWINVGMALQDGGYPFYLWDDWSKKGSKYTGNTGDHWKSFHGGGGISIGTLVKMAKDNGYEERTYNPIHKPLEVNVSEKTDQGGDAECVTEVLHQADGTKIEKQQLYYIKDTDISPAIESSDFVQGLLSNGALSVVYGPSNCGKTFFMTDLAFHVASGRVWRGRRVEQGGVIYAALEGSYGLRNRVTAYKSKIGGLNGKFAMVPCQVDFFNPEENIAEFIALIKTAEQDIGNIKLVVIDTLARAIAGGDENSGKDMGMLIKHADMIRMLTGAHVSFIHHSGKDETKGARGHSSLRAATDTEIEISRSQDEDFSRVRVSKQREMEMAEDMQFSLSSVVVGQNKYGEDITSCVVEPCDIPDVKKSRSMTATQTFVYDAIVDCLLECGTERPVLPGHSINSISYSDLRTTLERKGFARMISKGSEIADKERVKSATQTARISLQKMGKIAFTNHYIWLV